MDSSDEEDILAGPGWENLKESTNKLRGNFNSLCDTLSMIVDLENTKLMSTGRVEIPDTSRRILDKQIQVIGKLRETVCNYQIVELDSGDTQPQYALLYQQLVADVNKTITTLCTGLTAKLSEKTDAERKLLEDNLNLRNRNLDLDKELMKQNTKQVQLQGDVNILVARCKKLQEILNEKSKKIEQLQRQSTVALWLREKQKIIEKIGNRENELEHKLHSVSGEFDKTKDLLNNRIEELKYENNVLKTKQKISRNTLTRQESDQLKRILFIKERALIVAESELRKQQVYYAGLLCGLRKDFDVLLSKDNVKKTDIKLHHRAFINKMEKITSGVKEGNLVQVRASLPSSYHGVDVQVKGSPVKSSSLKPTLCVDNNAIDVDLDSVEGNANISKWRENSSVVTPSLKQQLENIKKEHPSLISTDGSLKVNEALTLFPYYSETKLREFYEIFKKLDDNGDRNLDTSEILHNIPSHLGYMATTDEVADAVQEIDIDESGTIDFFEFLILNRTIEQDEGNSMLLRKQSEKQKNEKTTDSKVCSLM